MSQYHSVLVAIDVFSEEYDIVLEKALTVQNTPTNLHLIYVAYPQTNFEPYGLFLERDFTEEVREQAGKKLADVAQKYSVPADQIHVTIGSAAEEIHQTALAIDADLIVVGTHGQSGMQLLLGCTASSVLHGIQCDLLAVRV